MAGTVSPVRLEPTPVVGSYKFSSISAGGQPGLADHGHFCGIELGTGAVYCYGRGKLCSACKHVHGTETPCPYASSWPQRQMCLAPFSMQATLDSLVTGPRPTSSPP